MIDRGTWGARLQAFAVGPYSPQPATTGAWDWILAAGLAALGLAISAFAQGALSPGLYTHMDTYFQADPPRVLANMFDRLSPDNDRTIVHPAFAILAFPIAHSLAALGLSHMAAAEAMILACAALTPALLYFSFRALGLPRLAAGAFVGVFLASATFIHWFAVVDTFAFSSVTIALMMFVLTAARTDQRALWILSSAATLAITTTNWWLGLLASVFRLGFRKAAIVSAAALGIVLALSLAQNAIFPHAQMFFDLTGLLKEKQFTQLERQSSGGAPWTPKSNLRAAIVTSAVTPEPTVFEGGYPPKRYNFVNNQYSPLTSTPVLGLAAIACWLGLLSAGVLGVALHKPARPVGLALGAYVIAELTLHLFYGDLTFLYAANYFPAMLGLAAFGWFTPLRAPVIALAAGFIVLAGVSNVETFNIAASLTNSLVK